jgi:hypothetical protein
MVTQHLIMSDTSTHTPAERVALIVTSCLKGLAMSRAELEQATARLEKVEAYLDKLSHALTKNTSNTHE